LTLYRQHLYERKERAFLKWMRSGYRDIAAHDEFLHYYCLLTGGKMPVKA